MQFLNVIAVLSTIIGNALANILPFNGVYTGTVADAYPSLFTPPGYVFAIWGVIYTLLFIFMVYQVRSSQQGADYIRQIGVLFLIGAVFNNVWLVMFHYSYPAPSPLFPLTTVPIALLLVTLLLTYLRLGIGKKAVPLSERLAVHLPVGVYLGWISLATIANIASTLNALVVGIPTETQELATVSVILVALLLTLLITHRRHEFAFGLVVIWASVGIAVKQAAHFIILFTALGTAVSIAVALIVVPVLPALRKHFVGFYLLRNTEA
ncbi:MAG: tryptophan-rich sensory protein [Candidatus Thorarchaeota archaeon]|nr:tryptophan-rich sensory protein [Candidatus Thorarchaeota archaeon]